MLKAYSKKYKDRNVQVNKTPFSFNSAGYCAVPDFANARADFEQLLKKPHIEEVCDLPEPEEQVSREEDTREGIDAPLFAEEEAPEEEVLEEAEVEEDLEVEVDEAEEEAPEEEDLDDDPEESFMDLID